MKLLLKKFLWKKNNKHNFTTISNLFNLNKVSVGNYSYGALCVKTYGNMNEKLKIGSFCSIADDVTFILGGNHDYHYVSSYPFKKKVLKEKICEAKTKGDIVVKDDVWIGFGATILSGVTIGQGAIIGAKSIVTKDVPPYAIFIGNKTVKFRFSQNIIDKLLTINFNILDNKIIEKNINLFYMEITEENIDELMKNITNGK